MCTGAGDHPEEAIRALAAEHGAALLQYALRLTGGDQQHAEDLVQETLLRAWQHSGALAGQDCRPWLFTVIRNLAASAHRARQARPPETGPGPLELIPAADDSAPELPEVTAALAALQPDHLRIIIEMYYRGRSVAEAAAILGIPAGTVKSRTFYALRALRAALDTAAAEGDGGGGGGLTGDSDGGGS